MATPEETRRGQRIRAKAQEDTHLTAGRRKLTPAGAARAGRRGQRIILGRASYSARGVLTAELLAGVGLVALRAVEDYEPQADGTLKGKIGHPAGQYGPLPVLAGILVWFWLLSFLAARGGTRAKIAVIAGATTDLVLAMKSMGQINKVAGTFSHFGKAHRPAGDWQSAGTVAGQPISGTLPSSSTGPGNAGSSGGQSWPVKGKCPPGHKKNAAGFCAPAPDQQGKCPPGYMSDGFSGCIPIPQT